MHAFQDDVDGGLRGALQVGVLDAQDEGAAVRAGEGPRVQGRADVAEVDEARRRRGEAGSDAVRSVGLFRSRW